MVRRLLWATVGGALASQAYLWNGLFALPAVIVLGLALGPPYPITGWRREVTWACVVFESLIGIHCWGFTHYGLPLYAATIAYMAVSGLLLGLAVVGLSKRPRITPMRVALAWVAVEAVHQIGQFGFPLFLGATQVHLPWRSAMSVVGSLGVSGLLIGTGVALTTSRRSLASWIGVTVVVSAFGLWQPGLAPAGPKRPIAAVQGGIPSWLYQVSESSEVAAHLVESQYFDLTEEVLQEPVEIVFLPESALHRDIAISDGVAAEPLFRPPERLGSSEAFVVTGAYREVWQGSELSVFNTALLLAGDDGRRVLETVDKKILAPVVESPFSRGTDDGILVVGDLPVGVLICYESMYPRAARDLAERAQVITVLTNDAGFVRAPITRTHARQGWSRAIEVGRPLVRLAQAGISLITDHRGNVLERLDLLDQGTLRCEVQPMTGWTWFTLLGYWVGPIAGVALFLFVVVGDRRRLSPVQDHEDNEQEGVADEEGDEAGDSVEGPHSELSTASLPKQGDPSDP